VTTIILVPQSLAIQGFEPNQIGPAVIWSAAPLVLLAFVAGLLASLSGSADTAVLGDEGRLVTALRFANAVGAITTTHYGAIPALPTRAQVEALLRR